MIKELYYIKKYLPIIGGISAIITMALLFIVYYPFKTFSQCVNSDAGYYIFTTGFFMASLGYMTNKKYIGNAILLIIIIVFDTYNYNFIHNIAALFFFLLCTYQIEGLNKKLFVIMVISWVLIFFNMLCFEIIMITSISIIPLLVFNCKNKKRKFSHCKKNKR